LSVKSRLEEVVRPATSRQSGSDDLFQSKSAEKKPLNAIQVTNTLYARVTWPLENERVPTSVDVWLIDAPWRGTNPKFKAIWPNTVLPNQDDETRRRELFALLEELRPHSTDNIEKLEPAPAYRLVVELKQAVYQAETVRRHT